MFSTKEAVNIANSGKRLAFAFSLGRDSAVMLHMMASLIDFKNHSFFHWTPYKIVLPYHLRYIKIIEKKYKIKINIYQRPESLKVSQTEFREAYLAENKCDLMVMGCRMDESLQRRGMLKHIESGVDSKTHIAYPLRSMTQKKIKAYVSTNRLILQPEYSFGIRDMADFRGGRSWVLRHCISEEDYQCAIKQDVNVEIDYVRIKSLDDAVSEIHDEDDKAISDDECPVESEND